MRYLVISDIHANLQALDAVLDDARAAGFDQVLCLGDLVGYGADPEAVVDRILRPTPSNPLHPLHPLTSLVCIRGNHDKVASGIEPAWDFHDQARQAIEWTAGALSSPSLELLRALPQGPVEITAELRICHGAPFDEDHYIFDARDASRALAGSPSGLTLFGHTHVPAAFASARRGIELLLPDLSPDLPDVQILEWDRERAMLVNVGAVGQPRDGDPRAAYGIVDTDKNIIEFRRVEYDIKTAQERILAAGLPERLATRLDRGA
jgi:diadenosine tetraphosphatase ApaH/serine/threonine PP2A family protein phosphatase